MNEAKQAINLSHFAKYGTVITDQSMLDLLNDAKFGDSYTVLRFESLGKGQYYKSNFPATSTFFSDNRLYYFMTNNKNQIKDFFELNTFIDAKGDLTYYQVIFK